MRPRLGFGFQQDAPVECGRRGEALLVHPFTGILGIHRRGRNKHQARHIHPLEQSAQAVAIQGAVGALIAAVGRNAEQQGLGLSRQARQALAGCQVGTHAAQPGCVVRGAASQGENLRARGDPPGCNACAQVAETRHQQQGGRVQQAGSIGRIHARGC